MIDVTRGQRETLVADSGAGGTLGRLDARAALDGLRVGRLHVLTIALLFLCLVVDGRLTEVRAFYYPSQGPQ